MMILTMTATGLSTSAIQIAEGEMVMVMDGRLLPVIAMMVTILFIPVLQRL